MSKLNKVTEHFRAYAYGESCPDIPDIPGPHAFDLSTEDVRVAICGLGLLEILAVLEIPQVAESDRTDLAVLCRNLNSIQAIIKEMDK